MNFEQALKIAQEKAEDVGISPEKLDNKRQRKKFAAGRGIVRQLAGLPHGVKTT